MKYKVITYHQHFKFYHNLLYSCLLLVNQSHLFIFRQTYIQLIVGIVQYFILKLYNKHNRIIPMMLSIFQFYFPIHHISPPINGVKMFLYQLFQNTCIVVIIYKIRNSERTLLFLGSLIK